MSVIENTDKITEMSGDMKRWLPPMAMDALESSLERAGSSECRRSGINNQAGDEDLMEAIAAGDSDAFDLLVTRHLGRVIGLASRMLGSRADAEEIAQEAFIRVWTSASRWRPIGGAGGAPFRTWLYRIVLNLVIDRRRKRVMAPLEDAPEPVDDSDDGFAHLHRRQLSGLVSAAIARLPERQRAALVLCFFEDHSNGEAADLMGLTVSAVESLLVRARRALKDDLRGVYQEL